LPFEIAFRLIYFMRAISFYITKFIIVYCQSLWACI